MDDDFMATLAAAAAALHADVEHLGTLDADQVDYLARAHEIADPLTDGIGCDAHERE